MSVSDDDREPIRRMQIAALQAKCLHRAVHFDRAHRDYVRDVLVEYRTCGRCGAWLTLGAANDVVCSLAVLIEIRAAELAAAWTPENGVGSMCNDGEVLGWAGWPYCTPDGHDELAGFLAAQIVNHERDLGEVNWAGQHTADHPIEPPTAPRVTSTAKDAP